MLDYCRTPYKVLEQALSLRENDDNVTMKQEKLHKGGRSVSNKGSG